MESAEKRRERARQLQKTRPPAAAWATFTYMMSVPLATGTSRLPSGGRFELVDPAGRRQRCRLLARAGFVVARVTLTAEEQAASEGGGERLSDAVERAVELALTLRSAPPARTELAGNAQAAARDQLRRIEAIGARGLCLALPALASFADSGGTLGCGDGEVLRAWLQLGVELPVVILVDPADEDVMAMAPKPLLQLHTARAQVPVEPRSPLTTARPWLVAPTAAPEDDVRPSVLARVAQWLSTPPKAESTVDAPKAESTAAEPKPQPPAVEPKPAAPADPPAHLNAQLRARLVEELMDADGRLSVPKIEDLFRRCYAPLHEALECGVDDERAARAVDEWRAQFVRSYTDSYATFRVASRRPTMVLDVPRLAKEMARLHGARYVELLLVDSLRFDLGQRMMGSLERLVGSRATTVDRRLLWAGLPTTTPTQLRLLTRGPSALADREPPSESEASIHRSRSAATLRRLRVGPRELLKLDLVEARLRRAGPAFDQRMTELADEIAAALAECLRSMASRTLVFVFGDHGFQLPIGISRHRPEHTVAAIQGRATPEEVLVPGYVWLVGERS